MVLFSLARRGRGRWGTISTNHLIKFRSSLFKGLRVESRALVALRRERNSFYALNSAGGVNFPRKARERGEPSPGVPLVKRKTNLKIILIKKNGASRTSPPTERYSTFPKNFEQNQTRKFFAPLFFKKEGLKKHKIHHQTILCLTVVWCE